jgi:hypothetical protein
VERRQLGLRRGALFSRQEIIDRTKTHTTRKGPIRNSGPGLLLLSRILGLQIA